MADFTKHIRVAAYGVAVRDGTVLLTRLSRRTSAPGSWTLPGGGVEFGEDPIETIRREFSEETGYDVTVGDSLFTDSRVLFGDDDDGPVHHAIRIVHRATVVGGELRNEIPGGSSDLAAWIPVADLGTTSLVSLALRSLPFMTGPAGLDHVQVAIPIGGEERARTFYGDLLGFREVAKPTPLAARGGAWFEHETTRIHVGADAAFVGAQKAHPAIRFVGLDDLAARLHAAGHEVRWDTEIPETRRFHTNDPFGNRIECIQA